MFEKYGFDEETKDNQWIKEDLVIYHGLGQDQNGHLHIELYTLCKSIDIGLSDKIIFRGELNELEKYFRRTKAIDELLNNDKLKKNNF